MTQTELGDDIGGHRGSDRQTGGWILGLAAYVSWGLLPLYFKALKDVPPSVLLAHRTLWSAVVMVILLAWLRRWPDFLRQLKSKRLVGLLLASSLLLAANWLTYIVSVVTGRIVEASLGYFINPLFSVLLGVVFFRERPGPLQTAAVVLAAAGIVYRVGSLAGAPWIALGLAGSFGLYGLLRKLADVESLTGLTIEMLLIAPAAAAYLAWQSIQGNDVFGGVGAVGRALVLGTGLVTAIPLMCFGAAARRLPLSTLGFLQYVTPSLQLALAVLWYGEPFSVNQAVSFGFIWAGLALFAIESILVRRRAERLARLVKGPTDAT